MESNTQLKPKLLKRFYEVLVLLRVLGQVQGDMIGGQDLETDNLYNAGESVMRRKVMYNLCVMCDFIKGGDTVTAIAAENLPAGPRYWVAAHGSIEKIKAFLDSLLEMLQERALSLTKESDSVEFESRLFEKFVLFQRKKIKKYSASLEYSIEAELKRINSISSNSTMTQEYTSWLQSFQMAIEKTDDFRELSRMAFSNKRSSFLQVAFDPIDAKPVRMESTARVKIRHYIGRLCAPKRAAVVLTYATTNHPSLFIGFSSKYLRSDTTMKRPHKHAGLTVDGISGRMFPGNSTDLKRFCAALQTQEDKHAIMADVRAKYDDKTWQPRVHAELVLLEEMYSNKRTFYDNDKFIACSKPACFCCYHYICNHPGSFVRPKCHNKVYLNWQPPELAPNASPTRHRQQQETMHGLINQVRQAVSDKVLSTQRSMRWHPDSTTGITPLTASVNEGEAIVGAGRVPNEYQERDFQSEQLQISTSDSQDGDSEVGEDRADSLYSSDSEDGGVAL